MRKTPFYKSIMAIYFKLHHLKVFNIETISLFIYVHVRVCLHEWGERGYRHALVVQLSRNEINLDCRWISGD